ncbi:MAG: nitroreductase [Deltaproteobacteria bacterium]|jgi:nitroreductase|nr:nitroreductase [Deltaproteobacteria bacterium]
MKNAVLENILTRRSIRKFLTKSVPRDILEQIVEAGLHAPSGMGRQPWHFAVLTGQERLAGLTLALKEAVARMSHNPYKQYVGSPNYTVNYHAPVCILVSADPALSTAEADCALAMGNIALAAHALGLGSCWINQLGSACADSGFRARLTELGVPETNHVYGCAAIGWPDGPAPSPVPRKRAVSYLTD